MDSPLHDILVIIQHIISFSGVIIILSGVIWSISLYIYYICTGQMKEHGSKINTIRLSLGRTLILGLEFIVAADLIGTTTAPDYYSVGILASIVLIRTVLSFSLSRELMGISRK
jgi:uncharacterized membrane protein